jgi:hypothetical protein
MPENHCSGSSLTDCAEKAIESLLRESAMPSREAVWAFLRIRPGQLAQVVAERVQGPLTLGALETA